MNNLAYDHVTKYLQSVLRLDRIRSSTRTIWTGFSWKPRRNDDAGATPVASGDFVLTRDAALSPLPMQ